MRSKNSLSVGVSALILGAGLAATAAVGSGEAVSTGGATSLAERGVDHAPGHAGEPYTITVGLSGYSPVSYLDRNRAEPGSPRFASEHDGVTYFFTSASQVRSFEADPARYLPAYGGYCAFGCSVDSKFVPDPTSFRVIDGRTHLFLKNPDVDAKRLWEEADASEVRAKADAFWSAQGGGSKAYVNGRNVPASGLGLEGYSPVSYFTKGRAERGRPEFSVEHNGVTYHLASAEQVEMFNKNPSRYEPQCGGWCAFGMSIEDKFPVDPTKFKVVDDRLYLFLNNAEIDAFELWQQGDQRELTEKAQEHWREVSGG
ncbi:MAG: YHS domain-containing (seleno)protein [Phycisphaerales bacterium JB040]